MVETFSAKILLSTTLILIQFYIKKEIWNLGAIFTLATQLGVKGFKHVCSTIPLKSNKSTLTSLSLLLTQDSILESQNFRESSLENKLSLDLKNQESSRKI